MIDGLKPYPAYKDSGVPWLGEVPGHWETTPLKRWVRMNAEVLPETTAPEHQFLYLDIGSVGTGILTQKPERLRFEAAPSRARRVVHKGDTIVSTVRTYLKAVYFVDGEADELVCSTGFAVLTPRVGTVPTFVSYVAQSNPFADRVTADSVGIAYPAIAETRFGSFHVAVPPLPEQSAIVRFLDYADRRIRCYMRAKQKLIKLLEEQKQAIIHRAVTRGLDSNVRLKPSGVEWLGDVPEHWEVAALRHRYSQCLGKMLDSKRITGSHSLLYLRNTDIQWDRINVKDLPAMDIAPPEYGRYTVQEGDLLVCEGGEVGRCAIWSGILGVCGFQKALYRLRPLNAARDVPRFMYYALRAAAKSNAFNDGHLSTIAHLTGDKLRAHRFPFPPVTEQELLVSFLDSELKKVDQAVSTARREISLLREYRTRLIADVVTGKLNVREAAARLADEPEALQDTDTLTEGDDETDEADLNAVPNEAEA